MKPKSYYTSKSIRISKENYTELLKIGGETINDKIELLLKRNNTSTTKTIEFKDDFKLSSNFEDKTVHLTLKIQEAYMEDKK